MRFGFSAPGLLAASLCGCAALGPLGGDLSQTGVQAGKRAAYDTIEAISAAEVARVTDGIAYKAAFAVQSISATADVSVCECAATLAGDFSEREARLWARFNGAAKQVEKSRVTNSDGTVTVKINAQIENPGASRKLILERLLSAEGTVKKSTFDLQGEIQNGRKDHASRTFDRAADGTWSATFRREIERPDGKHKTVSWSTAGNSDGTSTSTGTITRFDGSKLDVTISRSADGTVVAKSVDAASGAVAKVTKGDLEASASIAVESSTGKVAESSAVNETLEVAAPAE